METAVLAPQFWRQLGQEDKAIEVENMLAQAQQTRATTARPQIVPEQQQFTIQEILEERVTAGRAKRWFLVRWAGYEESWEPWRIHGEVGSPLETWEPLAHVRNTDAFSAWRERASESTEADL